MAVRLATAPFAVSVVVEEAANYGGWAVEIRPPSSDMAGVEVLVPDGAGREGLINAGSGSAFQYTGDDGTGIIEDALPILRAAAYGDLQTAGETLYLLGDRGWSTRGGLSLLPRVLRVRRRFQPYPPADPPPAIGDLLRIAVDHIEGRFAIGSEEISDDRGPAVRLRPAHPLGLEVVVRAGQDADESWSVVTISSSSSTRPAGDPDFPSGSVASSWEIDDWGDAGQVVAGVLATLERIASGDVRLALDGVGTVWLRYGGRWRALGPQRRRSLRGRPWATVDAWIPRRS